MQIYLRDEGDSVETLVTDKLVDCIVFGDALFAVRVTVDEMNNLAKFARLQVKGVQREVLQDEGLEGLKICSVDDGG